MTAAQTDALDQINALFREHFTCAVFCVEWDGDDSDKGEVSSYDYFYHGGHTLALGLAVKLQRELMKEYDGYGKRIHKPRLR